MCRELDFQNEKDKGVLQRLVLYVTIELAYQREHAKLQSRAQEWVTKGHPTSLLLQGADVKEKRNWLEQARLSAQEPPPTKLQADYVQASHKRRSTMKRIMRVCYHHLLGLKEFLSIVFCLQLPLLRATNVCSLIHMHSPKHKWQRAHMAWLPSTSTSVLVCRPHSKRRVLFFSVL